VIAVLISAVAWNYVATWRQRARIVGQAARILSPEMIRSAEGIEYSENERGVPRFKIKARKLLETRAGLSHLEGIEAFDFNPDGSTRNHIRSQRAEYDRDHKQASFSGDVRIGMTGEVELRTGALRYDLGAGVGTSDDVVAMTSPQARGSARGVRYDHGQDTLEFHSQIDFVLDRHVKKPDGSTAIEKVRARAEHGFYARRDAVLRFHGSARLESDTSALQGGEVEAGFSEDGKHVTSLRCRDHASYRSNQNDGSQDLSGDEIRFRMNAASGAPERIEIAGNALFSSTSAEAQERLRARTIRVDLDGEHGVPSRIESESGVEFVRRRGPDESVVTGQKLEATFAGGTSRLQRLDVSGRARMVSRGAEGPKAADGDELEGESIRLEFRALEGKSAPARLEADGGVKWKTAGRKPKPEARAEGARELQASSLRMVYSAAGEFLESGSASGRVVLTGIPVGGSEPAQVRRLETERARFLFYPGDNRLRDFDAEGGVTLYYERPPDPEAGRGVQQSRARSDFLKAHARESDGALDSVSQWGHFTYEEEGRSVRAGRSDYRADTEVMVLEAKPEISDSTGSTSGERMEYDRKREILTVQRRVRSVLRPREGGRGTLFTPSEGDTTSAPSVVTADTMQHWTAQGRSRYAGAVRLLSESGQLEAKELEIFDSGDRVEASGDLVHRILRVEQPAAAAVPPAERNKKPSQVTIRAPRLRYLRGENAAHYSGGSVLTSDEAVLRCESLDVVLDADGKRVERAAARGGVDVRQQGREARGEMADYYLLPGKFVVTGNLAQIVDPQRGKSSARRLTFFTTDDKILLEKN